MISVIVPVYNASHFLGKCIESVLSQTFSDYELIIVNDGSIDNSLEIMEKYERQDSRINIYNSTNKGVGSARNIGISQARGEWISFVDADDWMEPCMLETLYNTILKTHSNFAICNVKQVGAQECTNRLTLVDEVIDLRSSPANFVRDLMAFKYDYANWNKLYSADIIRKHEILFDEHMVLWEDLLFNLQYVYYVSTACVVSLPLYNYRLHASSSMAAVGKYMTSEYNKLYLGYRKFAADKKLFAEFDIFRKYMASSCYYYHIPAIISKLNVTESGYLQFVASLQKALNEIHQDIFFYPASERKGLQGIKKYFLMKRKISWFSYIAGFKYSMLR